MVSHGGSDGTADERPEAAAAAAAMRLGVAKAVAPEGVTVDVRLWSLGESAETPIARGEADCGHTARGKGCVRPGEAVRGEVARGEVARGEAARGEVARGEAAGCGTARGEAARAGSPRGVGEFFAARESRQTRSLSCPSPRQKLMESGG